MKFIVDAYFVKNNAKYIPLEFRKCWAEKCDFF